MLPEPRTIHRLGFASIDALRERLRIAREMAASKDLIDSRDTFLAAAAAQDLEQQVKAKENWFRPVSWCGAGERCGWRGTGRRNCGRRSEGETMSTQHYYNEFDPNAAKWLRNLMAAGDIPEGAMDERSIRVVGTGNCSNGNSIREGDTGPLPAELDCDLWGATQAHFFAGIGGWPLALRWAGWPGDIDIWTGSCPCQPFSAAGKRRGTDDERHLWPEFYRLICTANDIRANHGQQPIPVIFGEQVASKDGLEWLDGVFTDLEDAGYTCGAADLPAAGVGAPHKRQRLYWCAFNAESLEYHKSNGREQGRAEPIRRGVAGCCESQPVADSRSNERCGGSKGRNIQDQNGAIQAGGEDNGRMLIPICDCDAGNGRLGNNNNKGSQGWSGPCLRECGCELPAGEAGASDKRLNCGGTGWSDYIILECRDIDKHGNKKYRRAEPCSFPLVAGIPQKLGSTFAGLDRVGIRAARSNRVIRLKGYGNAIVPELAAEFISAVMEVLGIDPA